jgi:predicted DNA-binding transcriptional regulator YafY
LWGSLYQDAAQSALLKLDHILPEEQRAEVLWARRALVVSGIHRSHLDNLTPTLETLRRAIRSQHRVNLGYQASGKEEITTRQLDPYTLVFRQGWWYVVGYCHLRQNLRTFRVDRIRNLAQLETHFDLPADFNIHAYLALEPRAENGVEARLQFLPPAAALAHSLAFSWTRLEPQPDQSIIVTLPVTDLEYAAQMVLSFGAWVRVLEPAALQERVVAYARSILEQYPQN